MEKDSLSKVVFLGACKVGKSSLITRLRSGICVETSPSGESSAYIPTTENWSTHSIVLPANRGVTSVELVDTTGASTLFGGRGS